MRLVGDTWMGQCHPVHLGPALVQPCQVVPSAIFPRSTVNTTPTHESARVWLQPTGTHSTPKSATSPAKAKLAQQPPFPSWGLDLVLSIGIHGRKWHIGAPHSSQHTPAQYLAHSLPPVMSGHMLTLPWASWEPLSFSSSWPSCCS